MATDTNPESSNTTPSGSDADSGSTGLAAVCGDGIVGAGEHCDGAPLAGVDCPATCAFEPRTVLWTLMFDGTGRGDGPGALAFADDGVILVGGESADENGGRGMILRVSQRGDLLGSIPWELVTNNGASSVAAAGENIVAMSNAGHNVDIARFDPDGAVQWTTSYAVDDPDLTTWGGNIVAQDARTVLFGAADLGSATPGFIVTFEGPVQVDEVRLGGPRYDPVLDLTSFAIFSGAFLDAESVVLTAAVGTPQGQQAWMQRRRLPDTIEWEVMMDSTFDAQVDRFTKPAVGADGTIAVGWNIHTSDEEFDDIWVGKFSPTGELLWSDIYVGEYHRDDYPVAVAVDPIGSVFVIGTRSNDGVFESRDYDIVLLKYDPDGQREWVDAFTGDGIGGGELSWDYAGTVGFHPDGFVVACGKTLTPANDYDMICRALAP